LNRVDISNAAFSGLTTSLWPGLEMHEDNNLVPDFEDLFGQALDFLRGIIGEGEILSNALGPSIGPARIEVFGLAPENIWGEINRLNCALDITSTERVICASDPFNDVLIHLCFSFFSQRHLCIISSHYTRLM